MTWILVYICIGIVAFPVANLLKRFLAWKFGARNKTVGTVYLISSIALVSAFASILLSSVYAPIRVASNAGREISGVTGPLTADTDTVGPALATQLHDIKLDPGRTNSPLTVRYTWTPPGFVVDLPREAAAFMSGAGSTDIKITGRPCVPPVPGGSDEHASCARYDQQRKFDFIWDIGGLTAAQTIKLTIRLGATAVDGKFGVQMCTPHGDEKICNDKQEIGLLSSAGERTSVLYGGEALGDDSAVKSNDGVVTLDSVNGLITLQPTITNPFGFNVQELGLLSFAGTTVGVIFGNGIFFAFMSLRKHFDARTGKSEGSDPDQFFAD